MSSHTATTLSKDEELKLRAFQRQVDRLRKSSLVKNAPVALSSNTTFDLVNKKVTTTFTGFDPDAFQAQLPVLRQFVLNDDIGFNHICNIIYQRCPRAELLDWVKEARKRWSENLKETLDVMYKFLHMTTDSLEDALQKLFYGYGGLFHVDINAPEEEQSVQAVEKELLHRAFPRLLWCLNVIASVIYWWLDEPAKTVPPVITT